ncbi:MAG TPA: hypothetical protein VFB12_17835 [Ktedonobacteraceae bacterium]|nr:hypothetical protein [Ktedonobacteraceae bacterium]
MARQTLASVLETSAIAVARHGDMTVKIERTDDMNGAMMGYWYDAQWTDKRIHTFYFDYDIDIANMELDLSGLGIDTSVLAWEATDQHIDLSGCTCADCKSFLFEHGILAPGATFRETCAFRAYWCRQWVRWQVSRIRLSFQMWAIRRWYR